jgi:cephalosporin hydroxylase
MNKAGLITDYTEMKGLLNNNYGCGYMVDDVAHFVYSIVIFFKPDLVIQTGHLWGKSARIILEALEVNKVPLGFEEKYENADPVFSAMTQANSPKNKTGRLLSIDPNQFGISEDVITFLKDKYENFYIYKQPSRDFFSETLSCLKENYKDKVILGMVDGDHTYEGCMADLLALCDIGTTVILVDDTLWLPHIEKCCEMFSKISEYQYINFPLYNGIGVLIKPWKGNS